jgi:predicted small lipoprotein YifL
LHVAVCSKAKHGKPALIVMARCSLKTNLLENNYQINLMKTKILHWAILALAMAALAGCARQSEENSPPAATNSAGGQPMPGATVSNNAATPPAVTNPGNTNYPSATNQ